MIKRGMFMSEMFASCATNSAKVRMIVAFA